MNLVIDCFKLVKGAGKSIGIYNLAQSITEHMGERLLAGTASGTASGRAQHSIIVLGNARNRKDFDVPGVTFVEMSGNPFNKIYCILWELFLVPWYAAKYQADCILFPRGYRPLSCQSGGRKLKDTIIIHDLIPFYYDEHYKGVFNRTENAYIMNRLKASIRKANRIITISEFSRQDILNRVPGCEGKITVINNGLNNVSYDTEGRQAGSAGQQTGSYGQEGPYMVAMTSALPHKNAAGILRAYEAYYRKAASPLALKVIGIGDTSFYPEMDEEAAAHVQCYKFFEKFDEMCRLAAGARAYLFLSYMEGFGFPPLEAMQRGVPVVCSNRSSLPEVVGDAGILVDPDDMQGVAQALIQATTKEELRQELIQKGYENSKRFSWDSRTECYWKELFR